jgi:VWFA-related protein
VSLVLLPGLRDRQDGKAVRGLTAADFEVQQDGRRAEVVSFRYVDTTDADEQDELKVASAARRRFLLLFDKSFTDLPGLERSRRAASDFVRRRLAPSDLAAVATFDVQNGIKLHANFTDDRALLTHAIATLGVPSLARISDPLGLAADLGLTDLQAPVPTRKLRRRTPQALTDSVARVMVVRMRSADQQIYQHDVHTLLEGLERSRRRSARSRGASRSSTSRPDSTPACSSGKRAPISASPATPSPRDASGRWTASPTSATAACARPSPTPRASWRPPTPSSIRST